MDRGGKLASLIAIWIATLFPSSIFAWTSSGPPIPADEPAGVATDPTNPNVIYASDGNGFFRSDDAGGHWFQLSTTSLGIVLAVDPVNSINLYSGPSYGSPGGNIPNGILQSSDGGVSWSPANEGLTCGAVFGIAVAPSSPNVIYTATSNVPKTPDECGGIFRSDDFGGQWSGVSDWYAVFVAVDPTTPDIAYVEVNTFVSSFLGRTVDGGVSWQALAFVPWGGFAIDPRDASHVYAIGSFPDHYDPIGALYESHDRGDSWQFLATAGGLLWTSLVVDPASPNVMFASTGGNDQRGGGVFRSGDGGHSWVPFGLDGELVSALAIDSKGEFLHASVAGKGVFDQPLSRPRIIPVAPVEPFPINRPARVSSRPLATP